MLHDSNDPDIPSRVVVAAPITTARSFQGRTIPDSFVPIDKQRHKFLAYDSYISTHQVMPLNREWLNDTPAGRLRPAKMVSLDLQLVGTLGLQKVVQKLVKTQLVEKLKEFEMTLEQTAVGMEKKRTDPERQERPL